jgi:hypothetical protein
VHGPGSPAWDSAACCCLGGSRCGSAHRPPPSVCLCQLPGCVWEIANWFDTVLQPSSLTTPTTKVRTPVTLDDPDTPDDSID